MGIPRNLSNLAPGASSTGVLDATKGGTGLTSPGANGNILTSNGTTWTSAAPAASGAKAVNVQTFDSSGTWTKPTGYGASSRVLIEVWGGGGSGGRGGNSLSAGQSPAGGGGGGAYNYRWIALSALGATETVTIGAGGAARTSLNQAGITGGTSSLGSLVSAFGGGGGLLDGNGGGAGGQLSAGVSIRPGGPGYSQFGGSAAAPSFIPEGNGGVSSTSANTISAGMSSFYKGGGGGAQNYTPNCCGNIPTIGRPGGDSVWGGGGGGGANGGTGGASTYGGAGGGSGSAGTQPAGGGGGQIGGNSGAGGDGRIIVTVFDGA